MDSFSSTVSISQLSLEHGGNYTCSVENSAGQVNYTAALTINQPPSWVVSPLDSSCRPGNTARLDCVVTGEPRPHLTWHRVQRGQPEQLAG